MISGLWKSWRMWWTLSEPPEHTLLVLELRREPDSGAGSHSNPGLPLTAPGRNLTHDYKRHGTTANCLPFLNTLDGTVVATQTKRHRHQEWIRFLRPLMNRPANRELHLIVDNYATHKHPEGQTLAGKSIKRFHIHFTYLTSASWLNAVCGRGSFAISTERRLRRGVFKKAWRSCMTPSRLTSRGTTKILAPSSGRHKASGHFGKSQTRPRRTRYVIDCLTQTTSTCAAVRSKFESLQFAVAAIIIALLPRFLSHND